MGPIFIYYHVKTIGRKFNCTSKDLNEDSEYYG